MKISMNYFLKNIAMSFPHFHTYIKLLKMNYLIKIFGVERTWKVSKCVESIFTFPHIPHKKTFKPLYINGVDVWKIKP